VLTEMPLVLAANKPALFATDQTWHNSAWFIPLIHVSIRWWINECSSALTAGLINKFWIYECTYVKNVCLYGIVLQQRYEPFNQVIKFLI
jgi:hypothetical protein